MADLFIELRQFIIDRATAIADTNPDRSSQASNISFGNPNDIVQVRDARPPELSAKFVKTGQSWVQTEDQEDPPNEIGYKPFWIMLRGLADWFNVRSGDVFQARDLIGGTDVNTVVPLAIPWTIEDVKDDAYIHSSLANTSKVGVSSGGLYEVFYSISYDSQDNSPKNILTFGRLNGVIVADASQAYGNTIDGTNDRGTNSASFLVLIPQGGFIEIMARQQGSGGNCLVIGNQSWIKIRLIRKA
jgi:hypothetical protein